MEACGNAFRNGWSKVKLYFMMGLPTETDEDLAGIADLANRINELYHEIRGRYGCRITVSVASFVPKPFTPFQWMGQCSVEEIERKQQYLKSLFTNRHIKYAYHDAETGYIEAVLARGDRKLADVLETVWRKGAEYDSWTEFLILTAGWRRSVNAGSILISMRQETEISMKRSRGIIFTAA